jgi:hypothetical protein
MTRSPVQRCIKRLSTRGYRAFYHFCFNPRLWYWLPARGGRIKRRDLL